MDIKKKLVEIFENEAFKTAAEEVTTVDSLRDLIAQYGLELTAEEVVVDVNDEGEADHINKVVARDKIQLLLIEGAALHILGVIAVLGEVEIVLHIVAGAFDVPQKTVYHAAGKTVDVVDVDVG